MPYYAEACNEFAVPIFMSQRLGNTATCVGVEAMANRLQRCVRFSWPKALILISCLVAIIRRINYI